MCHGRLTSRDNGNIKDERKRGQGELTSHGRLNFVAIVFVAIVGVEQLTVGFVEQPHLNAIENTRARAKQTRRESHSTRV